MFTLTKSQDHGQRLLFLVAAYFCVKVDRNSIVEKPDRHYNEDNVNFTNMHPCFGCADVTHNVDVRSSKNSNFQQTIEAVVRDPTPTPPRSTLVRNPPVGNH